MRPIPRFFKRLTTVFGLVFLFSLSSFGSDDCTGTPLLGYKLIRFEIGGCSTVTINHTITGFKPTDGDRKVTVFYVLHSFKDGKAIGTLDASIGYQADVAPHSPARDGSQTFTHQIVVNPSGRLDAIKTAKSKKEIDKITLTVIVYQDNHSCTSDVTLPLDVFDAF